MNEAIITQTKQSGQTNLILYRLDRLDKQMDEMSVKKIKAE